MMKNEIFGSKHLSDKSKILTSSRKSLVSSKNSKCIQKSFQFLSNLF